MTYNIRNIVAWILSHWLRKSGKIHEVMKRASSGEIILSVYSHHPSRRLLTQTIQWFKNRDYHFLNENELYEILTGKRAFPVRAVFFSLDDGWKENYEQLIGIKEKDQIPITIFIPTEPVAQNDRYWWSYIDKAQRKGYIQHSVMSLKNMPDEERSEVLEKAKRHVSVRRESMLLDQIKYLMQKKITLGSHTITHPILTQCKEEKAKLEISASKTEIENWLGGSVNSFSYPNGMYGEREKKLVKSSGYKLAFTTERGYIEKSNLPDLLAIPRFDLLEDVSFSENICRVTGVWFFRKHRKR